MEFLVKSFDQLSLHELYRILQLRAEVFVVEQDCVYQDLDNKDQMSYHVLGLEDGEIHAYTRIIPAGISYKDYVSIGRVVNSKEVRGKGVGKAQMEFTISSANQFFPVTKIKISAQSYLDKFYTDLGFQSTGEEYLEDGIPHQAMILIDPETESESDTESESESDTELKDNII